MIDWWLCLTTHLPDDPIQIAKQCNFGQDQLAKVTTLTCNENQADHQIGRPALYAKAIGIEYTRSTGIQKGQV